ncbi:MAG: hypothetical protein R3F31_13780 [Verrucomicrobiales bacterium]
MGAFITGLLGRKFGDIGHRDLHGQLNVDVIARAAAADETMVDPAGGHFFLERPEEVEGLGIIIFQDQCRLEGFGDQLSFDGLLVLVKF